MYITSKLSTDQIVHEENCSYAKRIATCNRIYFYTAEDAYKAGKCACSKCSAVMKRTYAEIAKLQDFCKRNGISILFSHSDGTLDIETGSSSWKLALEERSGRFYLYHKNTVDYDNGTSPYEGYHFQKVWNRTILKHLQYIIAHDQYKQEQAERIRIQRHNDLLYFHPVADPIQSKRRIVKMRSLKKHFESRKYVQYASGM